MIELVKSCVVFNEENHTYMLGEKQLQGVTGMIGRQLFPDKYKDIPDFVLKKAAARVVLFIVNVNLLMQQVYRLRVLKQKIISE